MQVGGNKKENRKNRVIHKIDRENGKMRKVELLIPAGSLQTLKIAVIYGADAVYVGGKSFGLRARAQNFTIEELREGLDFAHSRGVKVYLAVNIFAHNRDLKEVEHYFHELRDEFWESGKRPGEVKEGPGGPDALIISDPGIFAIARRVLPEIEIHISTQANNTNYGTYRFWHELGAKRVVSARELSLEELREIRMNIPETMEMECFVHGAMCISYSGRCLLSNFLTGRDANQGACTHPCRWKYALMEETRPGEYLPVEEDGRGTYIFNSRDLCMIDYIPELIDAGIDSFKVEGRMKNALYVALTARTYRRAIMDHLEDPALYQANREGYRRELEKCTHREYTTGFYFGRPENEPPTDGDAYLKNYAFLGVAEKTELRQGRLFVRIEQKNKFSTGDRIEVMKPTGCGQDCEWEVHGITDEEGNSMESAPHAKQLVWVDLGPVSDPGSVMPFDILTKEVTGRM